MWQTAGSTNAFVIIMMRAVIPVVVKGKGCGQNCLSPDAQTTSYQLGHLRQITAFGALVSSSVPISRNVARIKWLVPVKGLEGCCQYVLPLFLSLSPSAHSPRSTLGRCSVG